MKKYIIQDLTENGYWSEWYQAFKGYIFVTKYGSFEEAEEKAKGLAKGVDFAVTIITIYE